MALGAGDVFAGYAIVRQLGSGGMGEVYLAQHPRLPRQDALKVLRSDISTDNDFRRRFIREADLAASLTHPNIVTVYDRGDDNGQLWIATQYIAGADAGQLLRRYPAGMPAEDAAAIITAIAGALDYAHERGVLHRDIKPANILLSEPDRSGQRHCYLADFGIARPLNEANGLTATNTTLGTFAYSAPEQLMGEDLDGRADQYALAATAYHMLSGTPPFTAPSNPVAVISQHLNATPAPVSRYRPELAPLDDVLARGLAKDPADRYPTCAALAAAITDRAAQTPPALPEADTQAAGHPTPAKPKPPNPIPTPPLIEPIPAPAAPKPVAQRKPPSLNNPPQKVVRRDANGDIVHDPNGITFVDDAKPPESGKSLLDSVVQIFMPAAFIVVLLALVAFSLGKCGGTEHSNSSAQPTTTPSPSTNVPTVTTQASPSAPPAPTTTTTSAATPSTAAAALPAYPPSYSGCTGSVTSHYDLKHPQLGPMRIFLLMGNMRAATNSGCVSAVMPGGAALPPIPVDAGLGLEFADPTTDDTGNLFIKFRSLSAHAPPQVLVLVPTAVGFRELGRDLINIELVGPGADGNYELRHSMNDCTPSCANGTWSNEILRWDGSDYI